MTYVQVAGAMAALFEEYRVTGVEVRPVPHDTRSKSQAAAKDRWSHFRNYLAALPTEERYDWVFFSDVRDVVFVSDPFALVDDGPSEQLFAALEGRMVTINSSPTNRAWVQECYGQEGLERIGANPVSCSGTVLASWGHAMRYLDLMTTDPCPHDQGVHNWILHTGLLEGITSMSNEAGFIGTVAYMRNVVRDTTGDLVNECGDKYAVVHQYDRFPALAQHYAGRFPWYPDAWSRVLRSWMTVEQWDMG